MEDKTPLNSDRTKLLINKKKLIGIIVIVLAIGIGLIFAGLKWKSQINEYKSKQDQTQIKINQLEDQIKQLKNDSVVDAKTNQNSVASQAEKDAKAIDVALLASCNKEESGYYYGVGDENGELVTKVTAKLLTTSKQGDGSAVYAKGFASLGVSCHKSGEELGAGGGYRSILARQADGSWKQLFGTQDISPCDRIAQYKIVKEVIPTCYDLKTDAPRPNIY